MYNLTLDNSPKFVVNGKKNSIAFAIDGSAFNPLEAFYAALAGCAGVFAHKACAELGLSSASISISVRPFSSASNPFIPAKVSTVVAFPDGFAPEQKAFVLESISACAVKQAVANGASIAFELAEAQA